MSLGNAAQVELHALFELGRFGDGVELHRHRQMEAIIAKPKLAAAAAVQAGHWHVGRVG